ncbi:shikimate dehydrogenase [Vibrio sp. UCD-FRSSP16_10]|uniref:shikimate dehydrogenase n=1 Tax=unclassified Vibrio TaxID=2614977 RepID=UPI0007FE5881|nr:MULTISPECIES: shikimate dehydrogenase [unclassified Vibrio]OBT15658.1 shikimate dehydrogenase [Vibrio sp. UCD-FRSSP16_30]OBT21068.1 shikimate dehydrogenase [Vibrio sp. UCD-FRSSP16_10]
MKELIDQYVVYGNPISQSKSPFIHTLFARQTNQSMTYATQHAEVGEFTQAAKSFFLQGGRGCNVTAPFKHDAYKLADRLTERAKLAGAVNTLKKLDDGQLIGDNTDGEGLVQDLLQYQVLLKGARILVIGAGGAVRGVLKPLLDQQPSELVIANRTFSKAQALADTFKEYGSVKAVPIEDVNESFDVVINSTSAGLTKELPKISANIFSPQTISYDMVYGAGVTVFNQWAKEHGAVKAYDGLGMLVGQAAESFMLWRGIRPGSKQILRELRKNLEGS